MLIDKELLTIFLAVTQKSHKIPMLNSWEIAYLIGSSVIMDPIDNKMKKQ